ncbi:MAG: hypothetical protein U0793_08155 [Gemmataceae bacterium]
MNILDENVPEGQRLKLAGRRIPSRQIGQDVGRKGMKDREVVPLLHRLSQPTFFTLDEDFYDRRLCHKGYCLVHLDVEEERAAEHVARLLRHSRFNTKAKRMGAVIRVRATGITAWLVRTKEQVVLSWSNQRKNKST